MLERQGLDTALARLLHRTERIDLATLRGSLEEARRSRPGATLAQVLAQRGLVGAPELTTLLGQLAGAHDHDAPDVGLVHPPADSLPAPRPTGRFTSRSDLAALPPASGGGTELGRRAAGSGEQSRPGRPSGRLAARPSGSWEVRPAEATQVGHPGGPGGPSGPAGPERADTWRPGGRVGDYVLERQAGAGAMGVVFLARHLHTGGRYAVKTLRNTADEGLVERFRREGEAQARVDGHVNVARVHSMSEAHGRPYLVMELAEGGNLDDLIKRGTPPWEEAARVVAGVARGLAHMHARRVLHRDLKPGNVLFDGEGTPKLVDFGLAKSDTAERMTLTGEVIGTPSYMAPEQALGRRDQLGPWTDAWALGGVLFYVLTGAPPFDGTTSLQVITRVAEEEAPSPRSVRADVPQALDTICRALMRRQAGLRLTPIQAAERLEAFAAAAARARAEGPRPTRPRGFMALVGLALTAVVFAGVALLTALPGPTATSDVAAGPPATPGASAPGSAPGPTPSPRDAPVQLTEPVGPVARWTVGQRRRCALSVTVEGEYVQWLQRLKIDLAQRLELRWKVAAVEVQRVVIDAEVVAFALRSTMTPVGAGPLRDAGGAGRWDVAFDSARADGVDSPFDAVVGATLKLVLDGSSGQVVEVQGCDDVQGAVFERAGASPDGDEDGGEDDGAGAEDGGSQEQLARYRVPLLSDPHALREALNGALHAFPPASAGAARRKWTLRREPEVAGPYWPGGLSAEVEVVADDDEPALRWAGSRRATFTPQWLRGAQGTIERIIRGRATLCAARDRVTEGSFKETWRSGIEGHEQLSMQATYDVAVRLTDE